MTEYERYGRNIEHRDLGWGLSLLLIGVAIGTVGALLYAPAAGQRTRRNLRRRYEDAVESWGDRREQWRERAEDWRERGRDWAQRAGRVRRAE